MDKKRIFTFWEPTNKMPDYLKLCMQTWNKFLGDEYEIIILNYNNLRQYLDKKFPKILFDEFSLPKQADAIRCAILNKYGGIWLDTDIIMVNENFKNTVKNDAKLTLYDRGIGFIYAKQNSRILELWEKGIQSKLKRYKIASYFIPKKLHQRMNNWNYLGNAIINKYLKKASPSELHMLNYASLVRPDIYGTDIIHNKENYVNFYFSCPPTSVLTVDNIINNNQYGFIYLNNSWTPKKYKDLSAKDFLNTNNMLAKILNKILFDK